jgi:hypothetical protein
LNDALEKDLIRHLQQENLETDSLLFENIAKPYVEKHSQYGAYETARNFMCSLGLLSFDYLKEGSVHMLSKTPALLRDLKGLDKKYSYDIIYVDERLPNSH